MKIRSVTIGDVLIVLLIASSNGNHKTDQLHNNNAPGSNSYIKSPQNLSMAGTIYQIKKGTTAGYKRSRQATKH
jgi:hypothetical protein